MPKPKGQKVYAVAKGRVPGIYNTWAECEAQVKGFGGAAFKSFKTYQEAESFVRTHSSSASFKTSQPSRSVAAQTNGNEGNSKKRAADTIQINGSNKRSCTSTISGNQITIHFDGGSRGNPGVAGAGAQVVFTTTASRTTHLIREYCGDKQTNNYAEYTGMISGLKQAKSCIMNHLASNPSESSTREFNIEVFGDSNLAIQQMNGCWQCKNENIKPLYNRARELAYVITNGDVGAKCSLSFHHVYREQNKVADELANEAMDQRRSWVTSSEETFGKTAAASKEVIELDGTDDGSTVSC